MDGPDPISDLGLGCPFNGTFYICKDSPTRFIGCCTLNPCGDRKGLCPDEHLEPATFEPRHKIPPQSCINDNIAVSWHTCPDTSPPFLGCCAVDPCHRGGCPDRELRAAKLSDKKNDADLFTEGSSTGSGPEENPSASLPIVTATLTASYISTKTIGTGIDATSTLSATFPGSQPPGKKGLSGGVIAGIVVGIVFFLVLVPFVAYIYSCCKRRRSRTPPRKSINPSSIHSLHKGAMSSTGSIYGIVHEGHMTGIQVSSRTPSSHDLGQEIHTRASSGEQHLQQESGERWTRQPQPSEATRSRPNFTIPREPVQRPNTNQASMPYPSTRQPPYPSSKDYLKRYDWGTQTEPWTPGVEFPGNTEALLSTNLPDTIVDRPQSPIAKLATNIETTISIDLPNTPVDQPRSPIAELPTNTETSISTARPSTPIYDIGLHDPGRRHPESPPRPPTTRPGTAPLSNIAERQPADGTASENIVATLLARQSSHDQ